jgi:hypothetical protein
LKTEILIQEEEDEAYEQSAEKIENFVETLASNTRD